MIKLAIPTKYSLPLYLASLFEFVSLFVLIMKLVHFMKLFRQIAAQTPNQFAKQRTRPRS
jgi:hypothetical protein